MNYKIGFLIVLFTILTCCSCGPSMEMMDASSDIAVGTTSSAVTAAAMDSGKVGYTLKETSLELKGWSLTGPQFAGMEEKKQQRLNDLLQKQMLKWLQKSDLDHRMSIHMDYRIKYQAPHFISLLMEPTSGTPGENVVSFGAFTINLNLSDELALTRKSLCWDRQKLLSLLPEREGWILPGEEDYGLPEDGLDSSGEGGCPKRVQNEIKEGSFWKKTWKTTEVYFTEDGIGLVFPLDTDSDVQDQPGSGIALYEMADTKEVANVYFPRNISWDGIEEGTKYWGEFQFDSEIQKDVYLYLYDLCLYEDGFSADAFLAEFMAQEEEVPLELLDQGVLYVTPDRIYRITDYSDAQYDLIKAGKLPGQEQILFQKREQKDADPEEAGLHWYIRRAGDEIRFFSYDNTDPRGKYEMFVWKRLFGLTAYRCGFGTEGDCIRIWKKDLLTQESVLDQDIFVPAQGTKVSEKQDMEVIVHNPWFPYEGGEKITFTVNYEMENSSTVQIRFRKLQVSEKGTLYELLFNQKNDFISTAKGDAETIRLEDFTPREQYWLTQGRRLGYYWVTRDQIYQMDRLSLSQRESLLEEGKLPDSVHLVCQEEEILDETEGEGWHRGISKYQEDIRQYIFYRENGNQEGRDIHDLVWKKNVGLIGWRYMRTSATGGAEVLWQEKYLNIKERYYFPWERD